MIPFKCFQNFESRADKSSHYELMVRENANHYSKKEFTSFLQSTQHIKLISNKNDEKTKISFLFLAESVYNNTKIRSRDKNFPLANTKFINLHKKK